MKKLIFILIFLLPVLLLSCSSNSKQEKNAEERWRERIENTYKGCLKDKSNIRLGISEQKKKEICLNTKMILYETTSPLK